MKKNEKTSLTANQKKELIEFTDLLIRVKSVTHNSEEIHSTLLEELLGGALYRLSAELGVLRLLSESGKEEK